MKTFLLIFFIIFSFNLFGEKIPLNDSIPSPLILRRVIKSNYEREKYLENNYLFFLLEKFDFYKNISNNLNIDLYINSQILFRLNNSKDKWD